jgi:hypothetical protein
MPIFMIERQFGDQLDPTIEDVAEINAINDEEEVRWLMSFLSADKRKTYCLYEAESPEAIRRAAQRAGIPAGAITELGGRLMPDASLEPVL